MSVLGRLPRWLRLALLVGNLGASLGVLIAFWTAVWPNLEASWFQFAAVTALAVPFGAWAGRRLDERQEHVARRAAEHTAQHLAEHHEATRRWDEAHAEQLRVLSDQVAALHVKFDQQAGGEPA